MAESIPAVLELLGAGRIEPLVVYFDVVSFDDAPTALGGGLRKPLAFASASDASGRVRGHHRDPTRMRGASVSHEIGFLRWRWACCSSLAVSRAIASDTRLFGLGLPDRQGEVHVSSP